MNIVRANKKEIKLREDARIAQELLGDADASALRKQRHRLRKKRAKNRRTVAETFVKDRESPQREIYRASYAKSAEWVTRIYGSTMDELCRFFDVSEATINKWMHEHPEFAVNVRDGRGEADANVADRLYRKALGYEHPATKFFYDKDAGVVSQDYTERFAPDTVACKFWLMNRRPDLWRERVEHTGKDGEKLEGARATLMLVNVTPQQAAKAYTDLVAAEDGTYVAEDLL